MPAGGVGDWREWRGTGGGGISKESKRLGGGCRRGGKENLGIALASV